MGLLCPCLKSLDQLPHRTHFLSIIEAVRFRRFHRFLFGSTILRTVDVFEALASWVGTDGLKAKRLDLPIVRKI